MNSSIIHDNICSLIHEKCHPKRYLSDIKYHTTLSVISVASNQVIWWLGLCKLIWESELIVQVATIYTTSLFFKMCSCYLVCLQVVQFLPIRLTQQNFGCISKCQICKNWIENHIFSYAYQKCMFVDLF